MGLIDLVSDQAMPALVVGNPVIGANLLGVGERFNHS